MKNLKRGKTLLFIVKHSMAPLNSPDDPDETDLGRKQKLCRLVEEDVTVLKQYGTQVFIVYCLDIWKWRQRQWLSTITCSQKEKNNLFSEIKLMQT